MDKTIQEVYEALGRISNATKKEEKIAAVKTACKSDIVVCALAFLLDPHIVTGISTAKIDSHAFYADKVQTLAEAMDYIRHNNTGSGISVGTIQKYIGEQPEEYCDFIKSFFTKTLRLGIEAKALNQILGYKLISIFEVQLADRIDNVRIDERQWCSISQKLNGNRCLVYRGIPMSRQGRQWNGIEHIIDELNAVVDLEKYTIDGELIMKNPDGIDDAANFALGTGILNSDDKDKSCIEYVIFDILPNDEFDVGESKETYRQRIERLELMRNSILEHDFKNIRIVPIFYQGQAKREVINRWLDFADQNNMEGVMVNLDTQYQCKRNKGIIKVKKFNEFDLQIVAVEEGSGRLAGTLGAVIVKYKNNLVSVGSGFTDQMRQEIWENKNDYIGRVVSVKFKSITKDKKTGKESLQFPIFVRVREDGKEPSIY